MPHPLAGKPAPADSLTDIPALLAAYRGPATQPVAFGTSGHRGTALNGSFNEAHILAIAQAVAEYRAQAGTKNGENLGPLFLGMDTHALSAPAAACSGKEERAASANGATWRNVMCELLCKPAADGQGWRCGRPAARTGSPGRSRTPGPAGAPAARRSRCLPR